MLLLSWYFDLIWWYMLVILYVLLSLKYFRKILMEGCANVILKWYPSLNYIILYHIISYISYHIISYHIYHKKHPLQNRTNVQKKGGGVKGLLNNVQKNCTFLKGGHPLVDQTGGQGVQHSRPAVVHVLVRGRKRGSENCAHLRSPTAKLTKKIPAKLIYQIDSNLFLYFYLPE